MAKNEEKEKKIKDNKKKEKSSGKENFFVSVKTELSKVKWPTRKEVLKYTIATLSFVILLVLFFLLMSLIISFVKGAFN